MAARRSPAEPPTPPSSTSLAKRMASSSAARSRTDASLPLTARRLNERPAFCVVLTHLNAPRLAYRPHKGAVDPDVGERLHVLQDDRVSHQGQPIALVIAETLEQATHAATLVRLTYASEVGDHRRQPCRAS